MITLALDTSSRACSAAVTKDGVLLSEGYLNNGMTHSRTLLPLIESALENASLGFGDLERIAVSAGPGSFTGLRIGLSMAKGIAFVRQLPCVPVSTLEALAYNAAGWRGPVLAVLDARAGQVYAALFELGTGPGGEAPVLRLWDDAAMTLEELAQRLPEGALAVGDGAALVCQKIQGKGLVPAPERMRLQRASSVAAAAEHLPAVSADALSPAYLRKPQAEREREARLKAEASGL